MRRYFAQERGKKLRHIADRPKPKGSRYKKLQ